MLLLLSVFGLDRRSAFSISHSLVGSTKLTVYKTHNGSIQLRRSARTQQLARAAREVRSLSPFSRPWQAVTILSSCQPVGGKDDGERQQKENGGGGWGSKSFVFLKSKRTWTIRYRRTERYNNKKKRESFSIGSWWGFCLHPIALKTRISPLRLYPAWQAGQPISWKCADSATTALGAMADDKSAFSFHPYGHRSFLIGSFFFFFFFYFFRSSSTHFPLYDFWRHGSLFANALRATSV